MSPFFEPTSKVLGWQVVAIASLSSLFSYSSAEIVTHLVR